MKSKAVLKIAALMVNNHQNPVLEVATNEITNNYHYAKRQTAHSEL